MAGERCRICRAERTTDKNGRCESCANVVYAQNMGMHYGAYKGWKEDRREKLRKRNHAAYNKILQAEAGSLVLPKCEVCGEYIWDSRRKATCSAECLARRHEIQRRKREQQETGEKWEREEPIFD